MRELDRLGWATSAVFSCCGLRLGVRLNDPRAVPDINRLLPPDACSDCYTAGPQRPDGLEGIDAVLSVVAQPGEPRRGIRKLGLLYSNDRLVGRFRHHADLLESFEREIDRLVSELATDRIFVHAGVVAWQGRAILIPGQSFSGKTTLVTALMRCGCTYFSDDYAVLDAAGRVHPYPRRLRLRVGDRIEVLELDSWEERVGSGPLPVGWVVVTAYQPEASFVPLRVDPGRTTLHVLAHTIAMHHDPQRAIDAVIAATQGSIGLAGPRGDAEISAQRLIDEIGSGP